MTFQELIALQKATGNQNVITPENAGRILGLQAQAEAGKQLAMERGAQAVEERKRLQALQAQNASPRLLETYDPEKGRQRFVFDKQGNVIGSSTLDTPAVPVAGIADIDRGLMNLNRGLATDEEKQLLRQAMRDQMVSALETDKGMEAYNQAEAVKAAEEAKKQAIRSAFREAAVVPTAQKAREDLETRLDARIQDRSPYAVASDEQRAVDANRADMYRSLQKLKEMKAPVAEIKRMEDLIRGNAAISSEIQDEALLNIDKAALDKAKKELEASAPAKDPRFELLRKLYSETQKKAKDKTKKEGKALPPPTPMV